MLMNSFRHDVTHSAWLWSDKATRAPPFHHTIDVSLRLTKQVVESLKRFSSGRFGHGRSLRGIGGGQSPAEQVMRIFQLRQCFAFEATQQHRGSTEQMIQSVQTCKVVIDTLNICTNLAGP